MSNSTIVYAYNKGYRVDDTGRLISFTGKVLSMHINKTGYYDTNIRINKALHHLMIHRLCAYQKYGDKLFEVNCVRHLDGNPLNNSPSNIEIGSQSENMMDKPKHIRVNSAIIATQQRTGYRNAEETFAIIDYYNQTRSYKKTLEKFNISSKGTLFYILKHKRIHKIPIPQVTKNLILFN